MKIRAGDQVVVICGKDKGKTGQVLRVLTAKSRVVVGGVNMRTKHMKKTPQRAGQKMTYEASIDCSNVMLIDAKTKKRTRVGYGKDAKGNSVRVAKQSGEAVAAVKIAKKDAKEIKETKESKETKDEKKVTTQVEKKEAVTPSTKQPFWKKFGFGAEAMADTGDESSQRSDDHSVPDQTQRTSTRGAQRGS